MIYIKMYVNKFVSSIYKHGINEPHFIQFEVCIQHCHTNQHFCFEYQIGMD